MDYSAGFAKDFIAFFGFIIAFAIIFNSNDLLKLIVPFKKAVYMDIIDEFRDKIEKLEWIK